MCYRIFWNCCCLWLLISLTPPSQAQDFQPGLGQVSVGYFSAYAIRPGAQLTGRFFLKELALGTATAEAGPQRQHVLFVGPRVGFHSLQNNYTSVLYQGTAGILRRKSDRRRWSAVSIGLGYQNRYEVTGVTVNFQGEILERERERSDFFIPSLQYEIGWRIGKHWGLQSQVGYGSSLSFGQGHSGWLTVGLGLSYWPATFQKTANEKQEVNE
ncbi:MAG: hypothetical protein ACFB10_20220 [Salibacteraceae bacterium]